MKKLGSLLIASLLLTALHAQQKNEPVYHHGFYLSMAIGPAFGDINAKEGPARVINVKGNVLGMDVQAGGPIQTNLILHGTIKVQAVFSPVINSLKFPDSYSFSETFIGAGITKYTPANFFATANIGAAYYTFSIPANMTFQSADVSTDPGFSFNLKAGKEWLVSKKWGLGGAVFFSRTSLTNKDNSSSEKWSSNRFGVYFHATFNRTTGK